MFTVHRVIRNFRRVGFVLGGRYCAIQCFYCSCIFLTHFLHNVGDVITVLPPACNHLQCFRHDACSSCVPSVTNNDSFIQLNLIYNYVYTKRSGAPAFSRHFVHLYSFHNKFTISVFFCLGIYAMLDRFCCTLLSHLFSKCNTKSTVMTYFIHIFCMNRH